MSAPRLTSSVDRRRFLEYAWWGVGSAMAMSLTAREHAEGGPTLLDATRSRSASPPAIPRRRASCCGPAWPPSRPTRARSARRRSRCGGGSPATTACDTSWPRARRRRRRSWRTRCTPRSNGLRAGADYFFQFDDRRRGEPGRPLPHRTRPRRVGPSVHVRGRHVPGPSRAATTRRIATWCATTSTSSSTSATTRTSTPSRHRTGPSPVGRFNEETVDLRTYRLRHTLHKLDPDLQAAHAAFPFVVVWDDHEVANDYSGLAPEGGSPSPEFTARRAAAYQAFYEHLPIRLARARDPRTKLRIYRRVTYGRLAEFTMLDDRQYRTDNPCGDGESLRCEAALERRLHDARPAAGAVGRGRVRRLPRPVEHRRPAAAARRARAPPLRGRALLERRVGRLPDGTPTAARRRRRRTRAQPGVLHRRLALDVRQRSQARLQGPDAHRRWPPSSSPRRSPPAATARRTARTTARWCPSTRTSSTTRATVAGT